MAKTVKVRIAVAVNNNGFWKAWGVDAALDGHSAQIASEGLGRPDAMAVHFVTADLPIPEPVEVAGEVEEVTDA